MAPPGLTKSPPGVHRAIDDSLKNFSPPPGLPCPQHLVSKQEVRAVSLHDHLVDGEREKEKRAACAKPPGVFAPSCPPGMFAPAGPPGVFFPADSGDESTCSSP